MEPQLTISARCRIDGCPLDSDDVPIVITITNRSLVPVDVPIAFLQQSGPVIRLIDERTRAELYLRKPPANFELLRTPTTLASGASADIDWVIHTAELRHFGSPFDVTAEITIATQVGTAGQTTQYTDATTLRFTD